jgi:hypothetical protein
LNFGWNATDREPLLDKSALHIGTKRVKVAQINKWFRHYLPLLSTTVTRPAPLDHKYAPGIVLRGCNVDWIVKSVSVNFGAPAIFPPACATSAGVAGTCCADATGIPKHKHAAAQKAASVEFSYWLTPVRFPAG